MGEQTIQIVVRLPGPDEPGFLRRQRDFLQALAKFDKAQANRDAGAMLGVMDALADQVAQYIAVPEGQDARELAYDLSEAQFFEILGALRGSAPVPKARARRS